MKQISEREKLVELSTKIFDCMPDSIIVLDSLGYIVHANRAATKLSGDKEMVGKKVIDYISKDDPMFILTLLRETIFGKDMHDVEINARGRNGKKIPVLLNGIALKDGNGEAVGSVITVKDLTELKELQEKMNKIRLQNSKRGGMKAMKKRLKKILNAGPDVFLILDLKGRPVTSNRSAETVFGYTHKEAANMSIAKFAASADRPRAENTLRRCIKRGHAEMKTYILTKDKKAKHYVFSMHLLKDGNGKPEQIVCTGKDLTVLEAA